MKNEGNWATVTVKVYPIGRVKEGAPPPPIFLGVAVVGIPLFVPPVSFVLIVI